MKNRSVQIAHICICIFIALSFLTSKAAAQTAPELVARARVEISNGEYDQAIRDLEQAAVSEPKNAEITAQSSRAYYLKKDPVNALTYANKAIKLDGKNLDALNIRGMVKVDQKNISGALDDFAKAIKIDPNFIKPYLNRALIYDSQKDFDRAIADYSSIIAIDAKYELAYRLRASLYYYNKADMGLALADINVALRIEPQNARSLTLRGQIYIKQKAIEDAMIDFNAAIRLDPNYSFAWFFRANAHYIRGRLDEALSDFARALEIRPDIYSANYYRGQIYKSQKKFDLAIAEFNKIPSSESTYGQAQTEVETMGKIVARPKPGYPPTYRRPSVQAAFRASHREFSSADIDTAELAL